MADPYRATRYSSICWSDRPATTCWRTASRTATAVGALEVATDRSSQLGQRITDSMAAGALRRGRRGRGERPAPDRPERRPARRRAASTTEAAATSRPGRLRLVDDPVEVGRGHRGDHVGDHPAVRGDHECRRGCPHSEARARASRRRRQGSATSRRASTGRCARPRRCRRRRRSPSRRPRRDRARTRTVRGPVPPAGRARTSSRRS